MEILLGTHNGKNVTINNAGLMNHHIGVIGRSGSGKSVESHKILCEILEQGGTVLALDIHDVLADAQIMHRHMNIFNKYLKEINKEGDGISCPLFSPLVYQDGSQEDELDTIEWLTDILAKSALSTNATNQKTELRDAVEYVVESDGFNSYGIKALDKALKNAENKTARTVAERLHPLTIHQVFTPGASLFEWGRLNIVRLSQYSADTQRLIAEVLLEYVWRLAQTSIFINKDLYIFVDEFQGLFSGKDNILATMLSEGRKLGINLILVTQVIPQNGKSPVMERFTQSDILLFLRPASDAILPTAKMIDPVETSKWCRFLHSLSTGEFVATGPLCLDGHECNTPLKVSAFEADSVDKRTTQKASTPHIKEAPLKDAVA